MHRELGKDFWSLSTNYDAFKSFLLAYKMHFFEQHFQQYKTIWLTHISKKSEEKWL